MTAISGSAAYIEFISADGTTVLSGDYTNYTYTPVVDLLDEAAGADTHHTYITSLKDGSLAITAFHQAAGTVIIDALSEGKSGTVNIAPEGTTATNEKLTWPVIAMGVQRTQPFAGLHVIDVTFQQNGARVEAVYA